MSGLALRLLAPWYRLVLGPRFAELQVDPAARVAWHRIRGGRGARLTVGAGAMVMARLSFERPEARIRIGRDSFVGLSHLVAATSVEIGDDVLVSWGVTIVDHDSHSLRASERARDVPDWRAGRKDWSRVPTAPVRIGDRAWIGFNATVLKGVTIGEGAVVGAGSIVTRDVPAWSVCAGNPARVIRELGPDDR